MTGSAVEPVEPRHQLSQLVGRGKLPAQRVTRIAAGAVELDAPERLVVGRGRVEAGQHRGSVGRACTAGIIIGDRRRGNLLDRVDGEHPGGRAVLAACHDLGPAPATERQRDGPVGKTGP